jgi:hypothetical protein
MSVLQVCAWLENSPVGLLVRETLWGFPIVVAIHIVGLTMSAGLIAFFDLRLLGVWLTGVPVNLVYRRLLPFAAGGFAIMLVSGGMLLAGYATAAYGNVYFRIKIAALCLAALNAWLYHSVTERGIASWNNDHLPPLTARAAGLASIMLWTAVILAGRMMSYTMF